MGSSPLMRAAVIARIDSGKALLTALASSRSARTSSVTSSGFPPVRARS